MRVGEPGGGEVAAQRAHALLVDVVIGRDLEPAVDLVGDLAMADEPHRRSHRGPAVFHEQQVRGGVDEQVAAGPQDAAEFGQRRHGLGRVEVLDHVGELDPVEALVRPGEGRDIPHADIGAGVVSEQLAGQLHGGL